MQAVGYNEYKYLVANGQLFHIRSLLESLHGASDPFSEGIVDSIYFDSYNMECFNQCLEGEQIKNKFRIRGYGDGTYHQIHLKQKDMFHVKKIKNKIHPVTSTHFMGPEWNSIVPATEKTDNFDAIMAMSSTLGYLIPIIRVKYYRYRFRVNDYRITLDTNVEVSGFNNGFDRRQDYAIIPHHVLEVKSVTPRPYLPFQGAITLPQISYSKFYLGINLLATGSLAS